MSTAPWLSPIDDGFHNKVLFTTGYTRDAVVRNGVLDPGVNLLQKPASLDQLAAKLRMVLDG